MHSRLTPALSGSMTTPVQRWEQRTEWPLAAFAALFLAAYAWPILDQHLGYPWRGICHTFDYLIWGVFIADYLIRLGLADYRWQYWSRHLPDLAVVALPIMRPLRLLRLVMLLRVLNRRATDSLRGQVATYVSGAVGLLLFCASLAVLDAERHARNANITTFGDALWWSVTTVSTVGYGDRYPVTTEGRLVAVGLMLGGIALIGVVTASFATWLIDKVRATEVEAQAITRHDLAQVMSQLELIAARLDALDPTSHQTDQPQAL